MCQNVAYNRPNVQYLLKFVHPHKLEQISNPDFSALLESIPEMASTKQTRHDYDRGHIPCTKIQ